MTFGCRPPGRSAHTHSPKPQQKRLRTTTATTVSIARPTSPGIFLSTASAATNTREPASNDASPAPLRRRAPRSDNRRLPPEPAHLITSRYSKSYSPSTARPLARSSTLASPRLLRAPGARRAVHTADCEPNTAAPVLGVYPRLDRAPCNRATCYRHNQKSSSLLRYSLLFPAPDK